MRSVDRIRIDDPGFRFRDYGHSDDARARQPWQVRVHRNFFGAGVRAVPDTFADPGVQAEVPAERENAGRIGKERQRCKLEVYDSLFRGRAMKSFVRALIEVVILGFGAMPVGAFATDALEIMKQVDDSYRKAFTTAVVKVQLSTCKYVANNDGLSCKEKP